MARKTQVCIQLCYHPHPARRDCVFFPLELISAVLIEVAGLGNALEMAGKGVWLNRTCPKLVKQCSRAVTPNSKYSRSYLSHITEGCILPDCIAMEGDSYQQH